MRYKLLVILLLLSFTASARWEYRITKQKAIGYSFTTTNVSHNLQILYKFKR